jgi:hypothetical protein
MKAYWEWRYSSTHSLTSALDGGEWSALPPGKESPLYPLDRRLGGPQSRSGRGGEEKIPSPRRESNPRTPIVQPVAHRYTTELFRLLLWRVDADIVNEQSRTADKC